MHIGFISTVRGYKWAGSEELWCATALEALGEGNQASAFIAKEMRTADKIQQFLHAGGIVQTKRTFSHPRLTKIYENIFSSYSRFSTGKSCLVLSIGSPIDPLFVPGLPEFLFSSPIPYFILCQFNADSLRMSPTQRKIIKSIYKKSTGCIFVSKHNLDLCCRQLSSSLPHATIIFNPIRLRLSQPCSWIDTTQMIHMACVARHETEWKGHDVLLDVLSQEQWQSRQWHLNLYGNGPDTNYIKALIGKYHLDENVTVHGYVRDVQSIWNSNHLMVLASRGEGTPLAVLEAMMCGRPTITTDVGGNREILEDGVSGFIAETATPYSFGRTLEKAWESRERWQEMGQNAHLKATDLAMVEPAQQLLDYLVECLNLGRIPA